MNVRIYLALLFALLSPVALLSPSALAADEVWIDVRSTFEHKLDHIKGDLRVSHGDIVTTLKEVHPDKDTPIALYCLSGGRASVAMRALQNAGYTEVRNVGGISDARRVRGLD